MFVNTDPWNSDYAMDVDVSFPYKDLMNGPRGLVSKLVNILLLFCFVIVTLRASSDVPSHYNKAVNCLNNHT